MSRPRPSDGIDVGQTSSCRLQVVLRNLELLIEDRRRWPREVIGQLYGPLSTCQATMLVSLIRSEVTTVTPPRLSSRSEREVLKGSTTPHAYGRRHLRCDYEVSPRWHVPEVRIRHFELPALGSLRTETFRRRLRIKYRSCSLLVSSFERAAFVVRPTVSIFRSRVRSFEVSR